MNDAEQQGPANRWQESVYEQLHEIANAAMRGEAAGNSLQPTMLVNDAYMRLLEQRNVDPDDRAQVIAAGATIIRRLLVDYARTRKAKKRGGAEGRGIPLNISIADSANTIDLLELNDALEALAELNPRAAEVVELRFFGGLTSAEAAERLDVAIGTVNNDWRFAKAWLRRALADSDERSGED